MESVSNTSLARIRLPLPIHGIAWGGADGRTLYLAAHFVLYRMRVKIPGIRPHPTAGHPEDEAR